MPTLINDPPDFLLSKLYNSNPLNLCKKGHFGICALACFQMCVFGVSDKIIINILSFLWLFQMICHIVFAVINDPSGIVVFEKYYTTMYYMLSFSTKSNHEIRILGHSEAWGK